MTTTDAVAEAIYEANRKAQTWLPPWTGATPYHRALFGDMAAAALTAATAQAADLGQRYSDRVTQDRPLTDTDQQLIHELLDDGTTDPPLDVIAEGALTILPGARVVMNGQEIGRVVSSARGIPATMSIDGAALGLTVTNWKQRAEAAEAELERFEPWCSCGTRKGQRADGTLICLAGVDHGDRLPTHWTKRP